MNAIKDINKWPKFLTVNGIPESRSVNKHLLKPWKKGEIVKVAPMEEQVPNRKYDDLSKGSEPITDKKFKEHYVKVIRKDNTGAWSLVYVDNWEIFDLLNNKK